MSGICDTCLRTVCNARTDGLKTCDMLIGGETNYDRLFGTPERAALTLASMCQFSHGELCERCPYDGCDKTLRLMCASTINDALLEWLSGKAVKR